VDSNTNSLHILAIHQCPGEDYFEPTTAVRNFISDHLSFSTLIEISEEEYWIYEISE